MPKLWKCSPTATPEPSASMWSKLRFGAKFWLASSFSDSIKDYACSLQETPSFPKDGCVQSVLILNGLVEITPYSKPSIVGSAMPIIHPALSGACTSPAENAQRGFTWALTIRQQISTSRPGNTSIVGHKIFFPSSSYCIHPERRCFNLSQD
jgi:hypothetical protein